MRTDNIFYQIFKTLPEVLFELLEQEVPLAKYTFSSLQLKELSRTIDGVFIPEDKNYPIYFIEVQFQKDDFFYYRLLTEIFIYLGQYKPAQPWQAVVLWGKRSLEKPIAIEYQPLKAQNLLQIIYLDELKPEQTESVGLGIIELVVTPEAAAVEKVEQLVTTAKKTITDNSLQREIIELIEKIVIYKFPKKSNQELESMFGLAEWKQTQFYQDVKAEGNLEGKLETIPGLLSLGLSPEQIAKVLEISLETVQKVINELPQSREN